MQKTTIEISTLTILKIFGIAAGLLFLWYIRDVLILLFVVGILVVAFSPLVEILYKKKIPRLLSVFLIYLVLAFLFSTLIYLIVPPIALQVREFTQNLPSYIQRVNPTYNQYREYLPALQQNLENISSTLNQLTASVWSAALTLFGGLVSFVAILILTFYILVEKEKAENTLISLLPKDRKDKILEIFKKVGQKLGAWTRGQLTLMLIVAILDYIILSILGVPYALILAIVAGILDIILIVGPILAAIPAILLALTVSPLTAIIVALAYLGVQQLEAHVLAPKILGKVTGLSPVVVIIAILIGIRLLGVGGAVLAVPVAASLIMLVNEWRASF